MQNRVVLPKIELNKTTLERVYDKLKFAATTGRKYGDAFALIDEACDKEIDYLTAAAAFYLLFLNGIVRPDGDFALKLKALDYDLLNVSALNEFVQLV